MLSVRKVRVNVKLYKWIDKENGKRNEKWQMSKRDMIIIVIVCANKWQKGFLMRDTWPSLFLIFLSFISQSFFSFPISLFFVPSMLSLFFPLPRILPLLSSSSPPFSFFSFEARVNFKFEGKLFLIYLHLKKCKFFLHLSCYARFLFFILVYKFLV